ncbi:MAG TPA: Gfo/Idh/MocA family oxidoreductase [Bryobacteraceae bacterium]|nr:Gfo/Idh/MocA family oxidoreductase [Bryobacteraceae bacterium]
MAVKWLVIGIGDITRRRVIPAILQEPHSELYGVVTRDPRKAEAYPGVHVWTALPAALEDPAVDAVYVASPVALHAPQTISSLRAGKHVLCEKPAAMSHAEAESMTMAAYASGRQFGVAYYRRFFPKLVRARQLIAEGVIGTPVLAEANCHSWLPGEDRNWLLDPAIAGAGPLFDIGSHRIDALNFLFGRPARVSGMLSNAVHQLEVEDSATVLIDYAEGVRGVVDVRWNSQIPRDQFRVIGTDGEINLDPLSGPTLRCGDRQEELPPHPNVHYPSIANFAQAVLDGAPLEPGGEEAIWTDWVMDTLRRRRR